MRLLVATRNSHKLRELGRLLPWIELDPLPDGLATPPEDGDTYAANALIKARAAAAAPCDPFAPESDRVPPVHAPSLEARPQTPGASESAVRPPFQRAARARQSPRAGVEP